jgi:uncharacterized damage-inducible protein DinB
VSFTNPASSASETGAAYTRALLELLGDRDPFAVQEQLLPALRAHVADMSPSELRRPEAPGKWSVLDVICHLADSELIYGYRLRMIVAEDEPALVGYDQDRWAQRLHHDVAELDLELERLEQLRRFNLRFLRSLDDAEWDRIGSHSERGDESVRVLFQMLAAHDLVHLRQIERIKRSFQG